MEMAQDLIKLGWILVQAGLIILFLLIIIVAMFSGIAGIFKSVFGKKRKEKDLAKLKTQFEVALNELKDEVKAQRNDNDEGDVRKVGKYKFERKQDS